MKVLKSNIFKKRKCKFGDFELVAEKGWKISQTFIDYESGLLVVDVSDENENNWVDGGGIRKIPSKQFIVDANQGLILTYKEWSKYFNYNTIETMSEDNKLKLITTRIHEPERNSDAIKEELIDVLSGKILSTSDGVAFREEKRKTLINDYYESIESAKRYLEQLELGEYPEKINLEYLASLKQKDVVIEFYNELLVYKLIYENEKFIFGQTNKPKSIEGWGNYQVDFIAEFGSLNDFWDYLSRDKSWFEFYKPRIIHSSLHRYIITFYNKLISTKELSYKEYSDLHEWMNKCWDDALNRKVYWQFCSNCKARVLYGPRYPKHACKKCVELIKDELGNQLNYKVTHEFKYIDGKYSVILKASNSEVKIFINSDEYWASEAKFGGIVHQKKENK